MQYIILLISLFFLSNSYAQDNYKLKLNKTDIAYIKQSPAKNFIIKRFKQYKKLTKKIKYYPTMKKLGHVNAFFNHILPRHDDAKYGMNDYWTTQKEFLKVGKGDCEDYAIAKYFTLLEVGIPKEKLYLAIVQVQGRQSNHMVLLYFDKKHSIPVVMDNLSFKILPLNKRKKLIQKVIFNETGSFLMKDHKKSSKVNIDWKGNNKWHTILQRVYEFKE